VVAFGGTLTGDLGMSHVLLEGDHPVETRPGSLIRRLLGERPLVSSLHHQAVADAGPCWHPTARADDGIIEAAEWTGPDPWPVLGVQWHPEIEGPAGASLFEWLVREARSQKAGPTSTGGSARFVRPEVSSLR
jgi:putative glutamine amidotransferase